MTLGQLAQLAELEEIADRAPDRTWTRVLAMRWPLPDRVSPETVREALRILVRRHEVLRSTFTRDASGAPVQLVHRPGRERITLRDLPPGAGEEWSAALADRACHRPMNVAAEPPVEFEVLSDRAATREVLAVLHHVVADLRTSQLLHRQLVELVEALRDGAPPPVPGPVTQPIETALAQWAGAGRSTGLARWREVLRAAPPSQLPVLDDRRRGSSYTATFTSLSLYGSVKVLADRHHLLPAQVLLGLYSFVMGRYTGLDTCVICVISSNRFAYPAAVHCCALRYPCAVAVPREAEEAALMAAARAATGGLLRNCDHDVRELRALLEEHQRSTGGNTRFRLEYNYMVLEPFPGAPARDRTEPAQRPVERFRSDPTDPADPALSYLLAVPDAAAGLMILELESNEAVIPLPAARDLLAGLESLARELAEGVPHGWSDQVANARRRGPVGTDLVRYRNGVVDASRVARAVAAELGLPDGVRVLVRGRGSDRERLVALLPVELRPTELDALVDRLHHRTRSDPALVVPVEFVREANRAP
ncbi:condensation domain-containing protein [Kitasatospora purpeofusca]|uniref:condensation domain-containing protein n=1 Tax=Kitasatospora purpeofusca TaxID=67352 RepID=UPI002A5AE60F|nr:condensation domain-containing protein [Kitasatospora purpeofusca]MDY0812018.1 condensation domain-containing protein [Kitasatospora purpeofusca]